MSDIIIDEAFKIAEELKNQGIVDYNARDDTNLISAEELLKIRDGVLNFISYWDDQRKTAFIIESIAGKNITCKQLIFITNLLYVDSSKKEFIIRQFPRLLDKENIDSAIAVLHSDREKGECANIIENLYENEIKIAKEKLKLEKRSRSYFWKIINFFKRLFKL